MALVANPLADIEMEISHSSRFATTVLCRVDALTLAGQKFTELYYYIIRSTDVYTEDILFVPRNLGNLEHAQTVFTRPSF